MTDKTVCYACGGEIEDGDWVIPLETFEARHMGDEVVLNKDNTLETLLHARCLKRADADGLTSQD